MMQAFETAMRKLASGPGNWISHADICNLSRAYCFQKEIPDPRWTALAAKLRVIHTVATDCLQRSTELQQLQQRCTRRPFPSWHQRCFFVILAHAQKKLADRGITRQMILVELGKQDLPTS
eukprot:6745357-Karenia_brevis.AAC.1